MAGEVIPEAVEVRRFRAEEAGLVSALVRGVFEEHVAPTFEPEGVAEMLRHVSPGAIAGRAETHDTFVAWQGARPVGVIEVRDRDHVSMLFVRTSHMGLGIATALLARAVEAAQAAGRPAMTVHSSLNARSFYERAGFVAAAAPQRVDGFAFVPMKKRLNLPESVRTYGSSKLSGR
jgi:GNAT superfamily N-acetyltransferase